ncbi:methyltransferase domain-containing protein [Helicobacter sp. 23-1045]
MWQNIWSKKGLDSADFDIASLMKADGFDTSGATLNAESWVEFFKYVAKMARCGKGKKRVLEVGCGSGAALKSLVCINPHLEIYGIDYSQNLVNIAKCAIKEGRFICDEAKNIDLAFGAVADSANLRDLACEDFANGADSTNMADSANKDSAFADSVNMADSAICNGGGGI